MTCHVSHVTLRNYFLRSTLFPRCRLDARTAPRCPQGASRPRAVCSSVQPQRGRPTRLRFINISISSMRRHPRFSEGFQFVALLCTAVVSIVRILSIVVFSSLWRSQFETDKTLEVSVSNCIFDRHPAQTFRDIAVQAAEDLRLSVHVSMPGGVASRRYHTSQLSRHFDLESASKSVLSGLSLKSGGAWQQTIAIKRPSTPIETVSCRRSNSRHTNTALSLKSSRCVSGYSSERTA